MSDHKKITGIIGAMDVEVDKIKEAMTDIIITKKADMSFYQGKIGSHDYVVVKCGIGKINAALCVQILVDLFKVDQVINTGIAGSLNAAINIGDLVLSTDAVQHDVDVTVFGYEPGFIPGMKAVSFEADASLRKRVHDYINTNLPEIGVFEGRVASGDQFICSGEKKAYLINEFGAFCAEMEGAAIAQAATLNHIPFLIIRAISDKADGSAEMDYPTFEKQAAEHLVSIIVPMAEQGL